MGGGSWSDDVPKATHTSQRGFKHSDEADQAVQRQRVDDDLLMIKGREIVCDHENPVGIVIDGTGSMGDWAKTIRDKSMMFTGQIHCQGYLSDPAFNLAVVGDANPPRNGGSPDRAPVQMTEFVSDNESFKALTERIYLEGRGGGHAKESYDLLMYGYARRVKLSTETKGFLFILGDEGFYETIEAEHLKTHFSLGEAQSIPTIDIIQELREKFHFYALHLDTASNYGREIDQQIQRQWRAALGENFINLQDPNAVVDVMLGCIALISGARNLDSYVNKDMVERGQTDERRSLVRGTLDDITWLNQKES